MWQAAVRLAEGTGYGTAPGRKQSAAPGHKQSAAPGRKRSAAPDHKQSAASFVQGLEELSANGTLAVAEDTPGEEPLGLTANVGADGKLMARVVRTGGPARSGRIDAISARGQRLGEAPFSLSAGATETEVTFELPLELRNQVTRLEIASASWLPVSTTSSVSCWARPVIMSRIAADFCEKPSATRSNLKVFASCGASPDGSRVNVPSVR